MNLFARFSEWMHQRAEAGNPDNYVKIQSKPTIAAPEKQIEIPTYLRSSDIPNFGERQEEMLRRAVIMYSDETNRKKWLTAVHVLLTESETGWVMMGGKAKFGQGTAPQYGKTVTA
jgi:hypothetical protein